MQLRHVCEVCQKVEVIDSDDALATGWDYPPGIGKFGIVGPRTCPDCPMTDTLWWGLTTGATQLDDLTNDEKATLQRIEGEPGTLRL